MQTAALVSGGTSRYLEEIRLPDAESRGRKRALNSLFKDVRLQAEVFGSVAELLASRLPDAASCSRRPTYFRRCRCISAHNT
jgi:hypothetical protein